MVTLLTVGTPILLITFALTFSPNLSTEDGMRCSPTATGMQNRFYMYNYCWENFIHYELAANGSVINERNMIHHKGTRLLLNSVGVNFNKPFHTFSFVALLLWHYPQFGGCCTNLSDWVTDLANLKFWAFFSFYL